VSNGYTRILRWIDSAKSREVPSEVILTIGALAGENSRMKWALMAIQAEGMTADQMRDVARKTLEN
jgi:hypothetical protein